jgi:hypothetical protein
MDMSNQILNEADKVIGNLMLEINRLINEIILKDKKIDELCKELALQKLSDISQTIERELTNDEIMEICDEVGRDLTKWGYFQIEFARAVIKKASDK